MTPVTAISYAMWAVLAGAMLGVRRSGLPLVLLAMASGARTMRGSERR
jgi:hypothetical protein